MTTLHFVKKARKANKDAGIKKGDSYYWWQFAFGSKQYSRERPRRSRYATRSAYLSVIYDIEDDIAEMTIEDIEGGCLDNLISEIENTKDEAESSLDNIPDQLKEALAGATLQEYIDNLESWQSDLEGIDLDIDEDGIREQAKTEYQEALESCAPATQEDPAEEPEESEEEIFQRLLDECKQEILLEIQGCSYPG